MRLYMEERAEGIRVWCAGDLDLAGFRSLRLALASLCRYGRPVIVDVGGLLEYDVVAVSALACQIRRLREAGLPTVLAVTDPDLRETLELVGCADVLNRDAPNPL